MAVPFPLRSAGRIVVGLASGLFLAVASAACGDDGAAGPGQDGRRVTTVEVEPESARLTAVGDTTRFEASALGPDGTPVEDVEIQWSSSDSTVATVDQEGLATAVREGEATIRAAVSGVSGEATATVAFEESVMTESTPVGDTAIAGSLSLEEGAEIELTGRRLEVRGDLSVGPEAAIRGRSEVTALVVHGDLTSRGAITSEGHLVLASDPDRVPDRQAIEARPDTFGITTVEADTAGGGPLAQWHLEGVLSASTIGTGGGQSGGRAATTGQQDLDESTVGKVVVTASHVAAAMTDLRIEVPDGLRGFDAFGCDVEGTKGGPGGSLVVDLTGVGPGGVVGRAKATFEKVTIVGGTGGRGGDASGVCPDGSINKGGTGGDPGVLRIIVPGNLEVTDRFTVRGFDGGRGGDGTIDGEAGDPGASVRAIGGEGGDVGSTAEFVKDLGLSGLNQRGQAQVRWEMLSGGRGGNAVGRGGRGVARACGAEKSANGGSGQAIGGAGGSVTGRADATLIFGTLPGLDLSGSFEGGDGGDARAIGGDGGPGVSCKPPQDPVAGGLGAASGGGRGGSGGDGLVDDLDGEVGTLTEESGRDGDDGGALPKTVYRLAIGQIDTNTDRLQTVDVIGPDGTAAGTVNLLLVTPGEIASVTVGGEPHLGVEGSTGGSDAAIAFDLESLTGDAATGTYVGWSGRIRDGVGPFMVRAGIGSGEDRISGSERVEVEPDDLPWDREVTFDFATREGGLDQLRVEFDHEGSMLVEELRLIDP